MKAKTITGRVDHEIFDNAMNKFLNEEKPKHIESMSTAIYVSPEKDFYLTCVVVYEV